MTRPSDNDIREPSAARAGGGEPTRASDGLFLTLSSRRAFEAFTGPVPSALEPRFRFVKPNRGARIRSLLPDCRLVISKNYPRPEPNRWIFEARRRGIPTLLLVDGPLEWANLYRNPSLRQPGAEAARGLYDPIVHDAVATIGEAQAGWIESQNEGRGIVLMSYTNQRIGAGPGVGTDAETDGSDTPDEGAERAFDFLVTTAKTPAFDEAERAALESVLRSCGAALESAGHRVLVRLFDRPLREALRQTLPSAVFEESGSFAEALSRVRCVIGTQSSVLLEAMQQARPTGTLMFRDGPLFYQTGWLLGCNDDWAGSFASMLARDPERMALQRLTLRENLSQEDFFAHCQRIAEGGLLPAPRPLDARDLEFENRTLRGLLGWRARLLAPLLRRAPEPRRATDPPPGRED